jgi:hypothetical protein
VALAWNTGLRLDPAVVQLVDVAVTDARDGTPLGFYLRGVDAAGEALEIRFSTGRPASGLVRLELRGLLTPDGTLAGGPVEVVELGPGG